ncbi:MAG TPA: hypothetical protein VF727_00890 [Allosphingosinicella sp.]
MRQEIGYLLAGLFALTAAGLMLWRTTWGKRRTRTRRPKIDLFEKSDAGG